MKLKDEDKEQIMEFLAKHPNPSVVGCSTMYKGAASCIKPIPTICGAEIMCHYDTVHSVRDAIAEFNRHTSGN